MNEDLTFDVVIAGGGIVGCACALACSRRGLQVALVERDVLGSGATASGMGHIVVMDDSDAQFALTQASQQLWRQFALPDVVEYRQTGTLWIAADGEEMEGAETKYRWYCDRGVAAELLTAQQVQEREPNLRPGLAGGLLIPEDGVVYSPNAAVEFARLAVQLGARIFLGKSAKSMGQHRLQLDDGTELSAQWLVNALGADAPAVSTGLPIRKRKGHLVITDRYPGFVQHQLVELGYLKSAHSSSSDSVAFNIQPRSTGQLLIGSSRQYGNDDVAVDQKILSEMLARATAYMPGIGQLQAIRAWTGFRAATPDKLPLIGPSPEDDSLLLATGHEGLGITTSLGTAELIASAVTGEPFLIDPRPYLPSRFQEAANISHSSKETE